MCLYKRILYVKLHVPRQTFLSFLCSVSGVVWLFLKLLEIFRLVLLMKDLLMKKWQNSNLNANQKSFLANKTVRHVLELYVKNDII